ncbi:MAG: flagellar basal body rod protein FlgC [Desulfobacterales bacterium]
MDFFGSLHTSSTGLAAQRLRMNLISSNLANINTTRTAEGGPYRRKDAVFAAVQAQRSFARTLEDARRGERADVKIAEVVEDPDPFQKKYDPHHPDADQMGYVLVPKINLMEEMVNMITATRSYEANVTAIKATKSMALKALEIGR